MKRLIVFTVMLFLLAVPVNGEEFTAPLAPKEALEYLPDETDDFADGILYILKSAFSSISPHIREAVSVSMSLIAISMMVGLLMELSGESKHAVELVGGVITSIMLFQPAQSLVKIGADTVLQISQYGKLLLPVMTGAMAAQGGISKSGAIYGATAFFDAILCDAITNVLIPFVYIFLCFSVTVNLFPQSLLEKIRKLINWLITWFLKTVLYIFTGYISITGIISGTTDATILKATKLTISGMVPVVGNILSDASEAVLVSAGIMKNAAGIYGLFTVIALWIGPFLKIGTQYLMLKITCGICEIFTTKHLAEIIKSFSSAMGYMLAMTGTICMIFVISTICFMKGVS